MALINFWFLVLIMSELGMINFIASPWYSPALLILGIVIYIIERLTFFQIQTSNILANLEEIRESLGCE